MLYYNIRILDIKSVIYNTGLITPLPKDGGPTYAPGWDFEQIVAINIWDLLRSNNYIQASSSRT